MLLQQAHVAVNEGQLNSEHNKIWKTGCCGARFLRWTEFFICISYGLTEMNRPGIGSRHFLWEMDLWVRPYMVCLTVK